MRGFLIENVVLASLKLKGLPGHTNSAPSDVKEFKDKAEADSFVLDTQNRLYIPFDECYPTVDAILITYEHATKASKARADIKKAQELVKDLPQLPGASANGAHVRFIQIKSGGIKPKSEMDLRAMLANDSAGRALWGGAVPARMKKVRYSVVWIATSAELAKLRRKSPLSAEAEEFISLGRIDAKLDK